MHPSQAWIWKHQTKVHQDCTHLTVPVVPALDVLQACSLPGSAPSSWTRLSEGRQNLLKQTLCCTQMVSILNTDPQIRLNTQVRLLHSPFKPVATIKLTDVKNIHP